MPATKLQSCQQFLIGFALALCASAATDDVSAAGIARAPVARTRAVPAATVGKPYSYDLSQVYECPTNPAPKFSFTWQNLAPVPGLTFSATGLISGTPTAAGTYTLAFQITDISGATGACTGTSSASGVLTVNQAPAVDPGAAQDIVSPAAVTAVTAPTIQISNIRQRLDQVRAEHTQAVAQALKVGIDGRTLPLFSALALASDSDHDGTPVTAGGASADRPDPFARWGVYANGQVDIGRQSAVDTQSAFKVTSNGVTLGTDYRFDGNHILGAALGLLWANTHVSDGGSQNANGYSFSFYGSYVPVENAYIDAIINAGHNRYHSSRQQQGAGQATSSTNGDQFGAAVNAGWNFNEGALTLNPYLRVEYIDAKVNGFTEDGTPGDALAIGEQRAKTTTLTLGGQVSYAASTSWGVLVPYGRLEWQYVTHSSTQAVTAQFAGLTSPSTILPTLGQDKSYGNFGVGTSAIFGNGFAAFFNYEQLFGKENFRDQKYTLGLRIDF